MNRLQSQLTLFRCALAFYTRLPAGSAQLPPTMHGTIIWLPFIGVLVGILTALGTWLFSFLFSAPLCGLAGCFLWTAITGGLHLDGLCDCADGLVLEASPEKRLQVMKDSRLGTFGGCALFFDLAFKACALTLILENTVFALPGITGFFLFAKDLAFAAFLARCTVMPAMLLPSARHGGMGEATKDGLTKKTLVFFLVLAVCLSAVQGLQGLCALVTAAAVAALFLRWTKARIGGVTGDVYGCLIESTECTVLLVFCAL
ncbi:MAG: adenosylcobinamide-GDP ribazoletransferase [Desulfovibrionaceae bacterium]|nr:adenosylcobinamide-GDP ribazoletransferase [Desulfovibrionaceae bacterium]